MGLFRWLAGAAETEQEKADLQALSWAARKYKERQERKRREVEEARKRAEESVSGLFGDKEPKKKKGLFG